MISVATLAILVIIGIVNAAFGYWYAVKTSETRAMPPGTDRLLDDYD